MDEELPDSFGALQKALGIPDYSTLLVQEGAFKAALAEKKKMVAIVLLECFRLKCSPVNRICKQLLPLGKSMVDPVYQSRRWNTRQEKFGHILVPVS